MPDFLKGTDPLSSGGLSLRFSLVSSVLWPRFRLSWLVVSKMPELNIDLFLFLIELFDLLRAPVRSMMLLILKSL